jgi:hypothetical protein
MKTDDWLKYIEFSLSGISILSCLIILLTYTCVKKVRSWGMELVFYLLLSSMINSCAYLIQYIDTDDIDYAGGTKCHIQAFIWIAFRISVFTWASIIGFTIYKDVISQKHKEPEWRLRAVYFMLGYGLPVLISASAYAFDTYGKAGNWCGINSLDSRIGVKVFAGFIYGVYWLFIIANVILTYKISRYLNQLYINEEEKKLVNQVVWKIFRYPFIQCLCLLPSSINSLFYMIEGNYILTIHVIHVIVVSLEGFFYALAYGYNKLVINAIREGICRVVCCCESSPLNESDESISESNSLNRTNESFLKDKTNNTNHSLILM